jgi:hypothetical protein
MKARINQVTGEILSVGEGRYRTDDGDVVVVDVHEIIDDVRYFKLSTSGDSVDRKPQSAIDAINARDNEVKEAKIARRNRLVTLGRENVAASGVWQDEAIALILAILHDAGLLDR